jgi:hypothetical protein
VAAGAAVAAATRRALGAAHGVFSRADAAAFGPAALRAASAAASATASPDAIAIADALLRLEGTPPRC